MITNLEMLLYVGLIAMTIVSFVLFFSKSNKIVNRPKVAKSNTHNKAIEKYISNISDTILIHTNNTQEERNDKTKNLKIYIEDGDVNKFIITIKNIFTNIIDGFKTRNLDQLRENLDDRLFEKFSHQIDKLQSYNLEQTLEVDYQLICVKEVNSTDDNVTVSVDIIANQIASVKDVGGASYDNPNNIQQTMQYNIDLQKNTKDKKWIVSQLKYEEILF